jgi:hypothetical protein
MSTIAAANASAYNVPSLLNGGAASRASNTAANTVGQNGLGNSPTNVTLSAQAQAALQSISNPSIGYYAQFFSTRDGSPATALALAVINPGAESSSRGKTLPEVANDARDRLDKKYAELQASGKPYDINSWEGKDSYTLFSDFDRRSLYAVSSNQGGKFTEEEQNAAQSILSQQQNLASGFYSGPTSLSGKFVNPFAAEDAVDQFGGGLAQHLKASVKFLDGVSGDEKNSIAWAYSRAAAQKGYEAAVGNQGKTPEKLDSDSPLVKLIQAALDTIKDNVARGTTHGRIQTPDDLKSQPWFQGFGDQLDAILRQIESKTTTGIDLSV